MPTEIEWGSDTQRDGGVFQRLQLPLGAGAAFVDYSHKVPNDVLSAWRRWHDAVISTAWPDAGEISGGLDFGAIVSQGLPILGALLGTMLGGPAGAAAGGAAAGALADVVASATRSGSDPGDVIAKVAQNLAGQLGAPPNVAQAASMLSRKTMGECGRRRGIGAPFGRSPLPKYYGGAFPGVRRDPTSPGGPGPSLNIPLPSTQTIPGAYGWQAVVTPVGQGGGTPGSPGGVMDPSKLYPSGAPGGAGGGVPGGGAPPGQPPIVAPGGGGGAVYATPQAPGTPAASFAPGYHPSAAQQVMPSPYAGAPPGYDPSQGYGYGSPYGQAGPDPMTAFLSLMQMFAGSGLDPVTAEQLALGAVQGLAGGASGMLPVDTSDDVYGSSFYAGQEDALASQADALFASYGGGDATELSGVADDVDDTSLRRIVCATGLVLGALRDAAYGRPIDPRAHNALRHALASLDALAAYVLGDDDACDWLDATRYERGASAGTDIAKGLSGVEIGRTPRPRRRRRRVSGTPGWASAAGGGFGLNPAAVLQAVADTAYAAAEYEASAGHPMSDDVLSNEGEDYPAAVMYSGALGVASQQPFAGALVPAIYEAARQAGIEGALRVRIEHEGHDNGDEESAFEK